MDVLRTPFYQEIPQAFSYRDDNGVTHLVGAYAQLVKHFAQFHRYHLQLAQVKEYKTSQIQRNIEAGVYNMSMFGGTYKNLFANITFSYPLEWSKVCVMVPAEDELPRYWYVIWPFGPYIWLVFCLAVPYVALLMTCLKHPSTKLGQNLMYSLAVILYCSNMNMKLVNAALRLQIFYFLLMVLGFITNCYYCSYLTMYSMRPIFQPFLKTVEDILAADIPVLVPGHILEELLNSPYVNLTLLQPVLKETPRQEISAKVKIFSRFSAYVITQNEWLFVDKLQRNLIQPYFQLSDICFGNVFSTYPLQMKSKFAPSLDYFILLVQQSGLWAQWQEEAFIAAIKTKYYRLMQDVYPVDPLNLYFYRIGWIVFFVGLALGCLSFIGEIVLHRYKHKGRMV